MEKDERTEGATDGTGAQLSRRDFLRTTGASTAVVAAASLAAPRATSAGPAISPRVLGANDRIGVGVVGVKGMGSGHIKHVLEQMPGENATIVAVCDVWEKARLKAKEAAKLEDGQVHSDFRRLLDQKDVDAVIVATPDHWHQEIAVATMESGRHVYIEKPMTRHLNEAFAIFDAAKRTRCLVQLGTQGCSEPKWQHAREVVRSGRLGKLLWAQATYCRNNPKGEWNYDIDLELSEKTVDWKAWLGPARKRAFSPERYFRWRKYWDYGTGVIGDLLPHRVAPLLFALGLNEYPSAVSCMGANLADTDRGPDPVTGQPYGDHREVADTHIVNVQFPSGLLIFLASGTANERGLDDVIRGHKADLVLGGDKVLFEPERPYTDELERSEESHPEPPTNHANHVRNFLEALRGNEKLNAPVELAVHVQTLVSMAEKAYRERTLVRFDPQSRKMRTA
jgi:predicted dehydrogenase